MPLEIVIYLSSNFTDNPLLHHVKVTKIMYKLFSIPQVIMCMNGDEKII